MRFGDLDEAVTILLRGAAVRPFRARWRNFVPRRSPAASDRRIQTSFPPGRPDSIKSCNRTCLWLGRASMTSKSEVRAR